MGILFSSHCFDFEAEEEEHCSLLYEKGINSFQHATRVTLYQAD